MKERAEIYFESPLLNKPREIVKVSKDLKLRSWHGGIDNVDAFPPKPVNTVLALLSKGESQRITILDWVNLFENKEQWDRSHSEVEVAQSSADIFKAIIKQAALTHLTLFRAVLATDGIITKFPPVLLEHIHLLSEHLTGANKDVLDIVLFSRKNQFEKIVRMAIRKKKPIKKCFHDLRLPRCTRLINETISNIPSVLDGLDFKNNEVWLVESLNQSSTRNIIELIERLLQNHKKLKSCKQIIRWLDEYCLPRNKEGYWQKLSKDAQKNLRKIIVPEYYKAQNLVKILQKKEIISGLALYERSKKQITERGVFWEHYQSRMWSVRVLIPLSTDQVLKAHNILTPVDVMPEEKASEAIIMEFTDVIIVEVLRGEESEIRLFENNAHNVQLLLNQKIVDLDVIRKLHQDDVHDHVALWQWACEKWLRLEYGIIPDDEVTLFKGLPTCSYTKGSGLLTSDQVMLKARDRGLAIWAEPFFHKEQTLGKYNDNVENRGIQKYAKYAIKWYKDMALKGDANAQYTLGEMYDKGVGVKNDRFIAQKFYEQSANQGNVNAQYALGSIYEKGRFNVRNIQKSIFWYEKAALQDHSGAQYSLGVIHDNIGGVGGTSEQVLIWFEKAAKQGHTEAQRKLNDGSLQYKLGIMYLKGKGVKPDYTQAAIWFKKAAQQGNVDARLILNFQPELRIRKELSSA